MSLFRLHLQRAALLSFFVISTMSYIQADNNDTDLTQTQSEFIKNWQAFEDSVTQNFHRIKASYKNICYYSKHTAPAFNYDVTLVGFVNYADGIGRHPILFKECLEPKISMNFLGTRNIPHAVEDAQLGLPRLNTNSSEDIGAVSILTDIIADKALSIYKKVPASLIKIAYTMFESTEIPYNWPAILNSKFDIAVVPDPFLVEVYKRSGVTIPIFVLPLPLQLHDFLKIRQRTTAHKPFVFGLTGGFWERKNHIRVLEAFQKEFGNSRDVKLRIHGRFGEESIINELKRKIEENNLTNVELIIKPFDRYEYIDFFKSLDCYVFLSTGEGFSITPREALAASKPCILTDNTAQSTICFSGAVRIVPANIPIPAMYDCHDALTSYGAEYIKKFLNIATEEVLESMSTDELDLLWRSANAQVGHQFDCSVQDAQSAMRDVYENYTSYLHKAKQGKEWVKRYLKENLNKKYMSLVKPASVVLGEENIIGEGFLMTNSPILYDKYKYLLGH